LGDERKCAVTVFDFFLTVSKLNCPNNVAQSTPWKEFYCRLQWTITEELNTQPDKAVNHYHAQTKSSPAIIPTPKQSFPFPLRSWSELPRVLNGNDGGINSIGNQEVASFKALRLSSGDLVVHAVTCRPIQLDGTVVLSVTAFG